MIKSLGAYISVWLLSRPSSQPINQATVRGLASLSIFLFLTISFLSVVQYNSVLNLGKIALSRETFLLNYSHLTLEMETNLYKSHRATLAVILSTNNSEFNHEAENRSTSLDRYWIAYNSLNALFQAFPQHQFSPAKFIQSFDNYKLSSSKLIRMEKDGKHNEALEFRAITVRPSFDEWKEQHDLLLITLLSQSKMMNRNFASEILFLQRVTIILLLFPVLAVGFSLLALLSVFGIRLTFGRSFPSRDLWTR
jgi:hypothetical protein